MRILFIATALLLVGCNNIETKATSPTDRYACFKQDLASLKTEFISNTPRDVQVFGDSHARGFSFCDPTAPYGVGTGYATVLAEMLQRPLDNRALGGSEISDQLEKVKTYGVRYTDLKVLMVGYNDAYFYTDYNVFKDKLKEVITIMSANAGKVIIGTSPNYYRGQLRNTQVYAQMTEDVVAELGLSNVVLVDVNTAFGAYDDQFAPDLIHFNAEGSQALADLFLMRINSIKNIAIIQKNEYTY